MRKVGDKIGFTGTIEQIREESGKRFCKSFGISRKNAHKHVNCPEKPIDLIFIGVRHRFSPYIWTREAVGTFFQLRQHIGGNHHVIAMNYSSGCLNPGDNELFTVIEWNDYAY